MRRFIFMTLLAGLMLMSGCSKNSKQSDTPTVDPSNNFLISQFKFGESLLGVDRSTVDQIMSDNGWSIDDTESVIYLKGNSLVHVAFTGGDTGKAKGVNFNFENEDISDLKSQSKYLDFIKYLGASHKLKTGEVNDFAGCSYLTGTDYKDYEEIEDYNDFINNFDAVFSSKRWCASWSRESYIYLSVEGDDTYPFVILLIGEGVGG